MAGVPDGWTAVLRGGGFVVSAVQTDASGNATVELSVDVPADAPAGTTQITVSGSGGGSASLPLDIEVSEEAAGSITMTTDVPSLRGAAGTTFPFTLTLHNDTTQDQTFAVNATGPDGWVVNATSAARAGGERRHRGGRHLEHLRQCAGPGGRGGGQLSHPGPRHRRRPVDRGRADRRDHRDEPADPTTPDQSLSNRGSAGGTINQQLVIVNDGTADLADVLITATMPRDWTVTYDPADTVAVLAAGESATVTAAIVPSNDAIAGDYGDVLGQRRRRDRPGRIRVTIETSPIWGFIGIGLIVAVLGGLWWVFRTYGRR